MIITTTKTTIIIISGTTALTGATRREYGFIAYVSANKE
jgi:hypothetical protein